MWIGGINDERRIPPSVHRPPETKETRRKRRRTRHRHHPHHQHHPTLSPDETCRPRLRPLLAVVAAVVIDSIGLSVGNVENYGNYVGHVDALEDVGSFDCDLSIDSEMGPSLISAFSSHTEPSPPDPAMTSERRTACAPGRGLLT